MTILQALFYPEGSKHRPVTRGGVQHSTNGGHRVGGGEQGGGEGGKGVP